MGVRAKEDGKSKGRFVISETKRMTAVETQAGAVPNDQIDERAKRLSGNVG